MKTLVFAGEPASDRYEICYQAIVLTNRQVQVSEWDVVVDLLKKLKAIGTPAEQRLGGVQLYNFNPKGPSDELYPTIELEKPELNMLIEFIECPIWRTTYLERVLDTRAWLKEARDAK